MVKNVVFVLMSFMAFFSLNSPAETIKWQHLNLDVPDDWNVLQTPMPSLHGYYLNADIDNQTARFFFHSHDPPHMPTEKLAYEYWDEFMGGDSDPESCKPLETKTNNAYTCSSIRKSTKDDSWSLKSMFWVSNVERLFMISRKFSSKEKAQSALVKIKVDVR